MATQWSEEIPQDLLHLLMKRMAGAFEEKETSQLSGNLLTLLKKRDTAKDLIRCGAVCRSWQAAASLWEAATIECPTSPFLLIQAMGSPDLTLFSPSNKRCYKLECPQYLLEEDVNIGGSCHGWLGAYNWWDDKKNVSLINPLDGTRVSLPPLASIGNWNNLQFKKIVWSSYPTSSSCTAMAIFYDCAAVVLAKPGQRSWQLVMGTYLGHGSIVDIMHFNDQFYVINNLGKVMACNIHSQPPQAIVVASLPTKFEKLDKYLVEMFGKLMIVLHNPSICRRYLIFEMKELEKKGECKLVPVKGLGGGRLFLSNLSSYGDFAPQSRESEFAANYIYFCGDWNIVPPTPLAGCSLVDHEVRGLYSDMLPQNPFNLKCLAWLKLNRI